MLAFDPTNKKD
jgi:hypothetical protein